MAPTTMPITVARSATPTPTSSDTRDAVDETAQLVSTQFVRTEHSAQETAGR